MFKPDYEIGDQVIPDRGLCGVGPGPFFCVGLRPMNKTAWCFLHGPHCLDASISGYGLDWGCAALWRKAPYVPDVEHIERQIAETAPMVIA